MTAIKEAQWNQVDVYTWGDLSLNLWEDFRLATFENVSEMATQGVNVESSPSTIAMIIETHVQGVNIVQTPIVMQQSTEMIVNIVVSKRDYKGKMLRYLPMYERNSKVFEEIISVQDREFRNNEKQLELVERNLFIDTAIEELSTYERDLGIKSAQMLTYDQRREQISSRSMSSFDQTTAESIKTIVKSFNNGDIEINQTSTNGVFQIKFIGVIGRPDNLDGIKNIIDTIAPAHLEFIYDFIYNSWETIENKKWSELNNKTWDNVMNEVS